MRLLALLLATLVSLTACGGDDEAEPRDPSVHNEADVEFTSEMIQHHAEALVMVDLTVEKKGLDPELLDLASSIRTTQALEIETMTDWLQQWNEEIPETIRDHVNAGHGGHGGDGGHGSEELDALAELKGDEFRVAWLEQMIDHHEGAVEMAELELEDGSFGKTLEFAEKVKKTQTAEIASMEKLLD